MNFIDRRAFMKLPLEERHRILAAQAEVMAAHYEQDLEWREWVSFESAAIVEYQEPIDEL